MKRRLSDWWNGKAVRINALLNGLGERDEMEELADVTRGDVVMCILAVAVLVIVTGLGSSL